MYRFLETHNLPRVAEIHERYAMSNLYINIFSQEYYRARWLHFEYYKILNEKSMSIIQNTFYRTEKKSAEQTFLDFIWGQYNLDHKLEDNISRENYRRIIVTSSKTAKSMERTIYVISKLSSFLECNVDVTYNTRSIDFITLTE